MSGWARAARRRVAMAGLALAWLASLAGAGSVRADQNVDLHTLTWYVHADLVTATEDLDYWQGVLDAAVAEANALVEGGNGPFDTPCCSRMDRSVSVATFGSAGDGLDVLDSFADQSFLNGFGAGSIAFLIDSITYCGGSSPNAIGCAELPGCNPNPNDDPALWMAVTVDSFGLGVLPQVIAHERGHNACLHHVSSNVCQIMQGSIATPGNGGCFTWSECTAFRNARTNSVSGQQCGCHASAGVPEPDGSVCTEAAFGLCSGGLCGEGLGDAGVELVASANPGSAGIPLPDDALAVSPLTGDWSTLGQISPTADDVFGLAFATDSSTLYGVVPTLADDRIVTLDPATGNLIANVGTIANGSAEIIAMAYDPGDTAAPGDDRLIMNEVAGGTGTLIWVDPASPSVPNVYGTIPTGAPEDYRGLAYDSRQDLLFAATPFANGLYSIDLSTCSPSPCIRSQLLGADARVENGSLSYSAETGLLYQIGTQYGGTRTFYDVIDPTTGERISTRSLDVLTPGGLAVVPEPGVTLGLAAGVAALVRAGRRRRQSRAG